MATIKKRMENPCETAAPGPLDPGFGSTAPGACKASLWLWAMQHDIHTFTTFTNGQPRPLGWMVLVAQVAIVSPIL